MNEQDVQIYKDRYNKRLGEFGYDPRSLGWGGGKERQNLRFKVIKEIGVEKKDSILDVGAGFGDLYAYLKNVSLHEHYCGYDINPELLKLGREKHKGICLEEKNILSIELKERFDWVVSSGIFNAQLEFEDTFEYIKKMISKMFELSKKGVCCDFMSSYVDFQNNLAFHMDPSKLIPFLKSISDRIVVRMDYLKYEFAVYLYKVEP